MSDFAWVSGLGLGMSLIALTGGFAVLLKEGTLAKWTLPAVAFAAGSLIGGAFFHLLPEAIRSMGPGLAPWLWLTAGFVAFLALEQLLRWHHCHEPRHELRHPLIPLILAADGLHNLIGGLSIGAVFTADFRLGLAAWIAAAMHEVPQEIGDFGVLVWAGLSIRRALLFNLLSALTFPIGMWIAWGASGAIDVSFLIPFGAGNFLYIAAADLIPEVKRSAPGRRTVLHFGCVLAGMGFLLLLRLIGHAGVH